MTLRIISSPAMKRYMAYERRIISGKIPCPFTCLFKSGDGMVLSRQPIPLTIGGKPKIKLFG